MTTCITVSIPRLNVLTMVHQCMRNSVSGKQICRELSTLAKQRCVTLPKAYQHSFGLQSNVKLWRTGYTSIENYSMLYTACTQCSSNSQNPKDESCPTDEKLTLFKKFKMLYKRYWYVLIPVHILTSSVWFGGFYYLAASGIDIPNLLQTMGLPDSWIEKVKDSRAGNVLLAYTLYKLATPLRYAVTVGATTISIQYLRKWGWIKPIPNPEQLKRMYKEQKGAFMDFTSSCQDKIPIRKDDLIKARKEITHQYVEAREGLQRSMKEINTGMKGIANEWKDVGGFYIKKTRGRYKKVKDAIRKELNEP